MEEPQSEVVDNTTSETNQINIAPAPEHSNTLLSITGPHQPKKNKKKIALITLGIVLLIGINVTALLYIQKHSSNQQQANQAPAKETTSKKPEASQQVVDEALKKFITPTTGETWLKTPKDLPDQKFFPSLTKAEIQQGQVSVPRSYKEVGARAGNKIIFVKSEDGPGGSYDLFEVAPNGSVRAVIHPDGIFKYDPKFDPPSTFYAENVTIDTHTHYDSLTIPDRIDLGNGYSVQKQTQFASIGSTLYENSTGQLVKQLGSSAIIKVQRADSSTKLTSYGYLMRLPFGSFTGLQFETLETNIKDYTWQKGASADDTIHAIAQGCGGVTTSITYIDAANDADFQPVGTTPSGLTVHEAKDPNYTYVVKAYSEFHDQYAGYQPTTDTDKKLAQTTQTEFVNQHAVIFYKNKLGQWEVYVREAYSVGGGCAKPVVYLYPTSNTKVNVRVGADVKVSDPIYNPLTGWSNVLAKPNGQLTVNNKQYDSLFWEGPGWGVYPSITSGTVVSHSQVAGTIRSQLAQQGLTQKESDDFMAYWQSKIPNAPYVRLTWFNTAQLELLAPLYITPKPNTSIRVFLDMAGLERPISLPAQQLQSTPRNGFTVVEWGGLAKTRLY